MAAVAAVSLTASWAEHDPRMHHEFRWQWRCSTQPPLSRLSAEAEAAAAVQVFFVRDGMKFPDMVHALKPNPKNHIQEGWRIMDFFSHHPEAMHMVGPHP